MATFYRVACRLALVVSGLTLCLAFISLIPSHDGQIGHVSLLLGVSAALVSVGLWSIAWIIKPAANPKAIPVGLSHRERTTLRALTGGLALTVVALILFRQTQTVRSGQFVPSGDLPADQAPNASTSDASVLGDPPKKGHFVPDPKPTSNFDVASAVAVPNPFSQFDCTNEQVVRYDKAGRAACLTKARSAPWEQYQDDPLAHRGDQCSGNFAKVYDNKRNEYCVPLERIHHFGESP